MQRRDSDRPSTDGIAAHAITPLAAGAIRMRINQLGESTSTIAAQAGIAQAKLVCILARRADCSYPLAIRLGRVLGLDPMTVWFGAFTTETGFSVTYPRTR